MNIEAARHRFAAKIAVPVFVIAFTAGGWVFGQTPSPTPVAPPPYKTVDPVDRNLDASLYMQTAAEYRAACYQAYNLAIARLAAAKKEFDSKNTGKTAAVIMDLDETVLDNAGFQAMIVRSGLAWDLRLWKAWEKDSGKVALIPGAKEFIDRARALPAAVIFVSNRDQEFEDETKQALKRLKIDYDLLKLKEGESDDKTSRFTAKDITDKYEVLLYVGDNLRDFDDTIKFPKFDKATTAAELEKAIKDRKDKVDSFKGEFGRKWIILPNPTYGEWPKPLGRGLSDFDRLVGEEKPPFSATSVGTLPSPTPKPAAQVSPALQHGKGRMAEKIVIIIVASGFFVFALEGAFVLWLLMKLVASKNKPSD